MVMMMMRKYLTFIFACCLASLLVAPSWVQAARYGIASRFDNGAPDNEAEQFNGNVNGVQHRIDTSDNGYQPIVPHNREGRARAQKAGEGSKWDQTMPYNGGEAVAQQSAQGGNAGANQWEGQGNEGNNYGANGGNGAQQPQAQSQPQPQAQPQPQRRPINNQSNGNSNQPTATGNVPATGGGGGVSPPVRGTTTPTRPPATPTPMDRFSTKLYQAVLPTAQRQNSIHSPASLHTLLGLFFIGAQGETASELQKKAILPESKQQTAQIFRDLLNRQQSSPSAQLIVATKIIYNPNMAELRENFYQNAKQYFDSDIEPADFSRPAQTANDVNSWVATKTNNRIQNLISPDAIEPQTQAIAVSAIYFKARWAKEFSQMDTMPGKFQVSRNKAVDVEMMYNDDVFDYADIPELDCKALELPYDNSELSMLLLLPNRVDGLGALEQQLRNEDLNSIAARLRSDTTTVRIPKFQIDFDVDMTTPLKEMGINKIFSSNSELTDIFDRPVKVSKIQQKAHISVNEAGSEAAASTYAKFVPLSLPVKVNEFTADHPFIFAIRSPQAVFFIGHVISPQR